MKRMILCLLFFTNAAISFAYTGNNNHVRTDLDVPSACTPYVALTEKYDWNVQTAINVMYNESSCDPEAVNLNDIHHDKLYRDYPTGICHGSFGLFQTSCTDMIYYDPALNVALAYQIYRIQGWNAWKTTCSTKIKCVV